MLRRAETIRDRIMKGIGTNEPWATEAGDLAMHYRKPLTANEINQIAKGKGIQ